MSDFEMIASLFFFTGAILGFLTGISINKEN